jgi:hypothetical protein
MVRLQLHKSHHQKSTTLSKDVRPVTAPTSTSLSIMPCQCYC